MAESSKQQALRSWLDTALSKAQLSPQELQSLGGGGNVSQSAVEKLKRAGVDPTLVWKAGRLLKSGNTGMELDQVLEATSPGKPYNAQINDPVESSAGVSAPVSQDEQWYQGVQAKLKQYADAMMQFDPNDPTAKAVANMASSGAQQQALAAGVSSNRGLGMTNNESLTTDALTRYQMQRQQMGQQAYNQMGAMALQSKGLTQNQQQFDANFGLNLAKYNEEARRGVFDAQQGQAQAVGSLIGGGLGAIGGGIAGGPMGAAMGASMGGAIGGGIGGMTVGTYKPQQYSGGYNSYRPPTGRYNNI